MLDRPVRPGWMPYDASCVSRARLMADSMPGLAADTSCSHQHQEQRRQQQQWQKVQNMQPTCMRDLCTAHVAHAISPGSALHRCTMGDNFDHNAAGLADTTVIQQLLNTPSLPCPPVLCAAGCTARPSGL
jgi:hypothetical protein